MIVESYPSTTRPKEHKIVHLGQQVGTPFTSYAQKHNLTLMEVFRRDSLIRALYRDTPLTKGMVVKCKHKNAQDKYGDLIIRGVCKDILEYGNTSWAEDDNPMIVNAYSQKLQQEICCTVDFITVSNEALNGSSC